jgi:hypothetical protein
MKSVLFLMLNLAFVTPVIAGGKIEYRLEAITGGFPFKWSSQVDGGAADKPKMLESDPFVTGDDFNSFQIKKLKSPPSKPNTYEIELVHNELGRKKFRSIANKNRERSYCVLIGTEIFQCYSFPPEMKGLWEKSSSIYGPFSKDQAEKLVGSMKSKH